MMPERDLRRIAAQVGLGVGQAEQEYVLLCVLDALSQAPPMADTFCLKGGTALRLLYFADWRHSVDLDFSVLPEFPAADLQSLVEVWFRRAGGLHGVEVRLVDFHRANGAARMRAQFMGPLRHPARLLFDITLDEPVLLPPQRRPVLASPFPDLQPAVLAYALEEVLAEKMRSILQRGKARDYYDVWRLLKEKASYLNASLARQLLIQKCQHRGLEAPEARDFLLPQRLAEAEVYWERDLIAQVPRSLLPDWKVVVRELAGLLEAFFSLG